MWLWARLLRSAPHCVELQGQELGDSKMGCVLLWRQKGGMPLSLGNWGKDEEGHSGESLVSVWVRERFERSLRVGMLGADGRLGGDTAGRDTASPQSMLW